MEEKKPEVTEEKKPCEIFFSYRRKDRETMGDESFKRLVEEIRKQARPLSLFLDEERIHRDDNFVQVLQDAVSSASFFVPLLTEEYLEPRPEDEDFCLMEAMTAYDKGIPTIPICVGVSAKTEVVTVSQELKDFRQFLLSKQGVYVDSFDELSEGLVRKLIKVVFDSFTVDDGKIKLFSEFLEQQAKALDFVIPCTDPNQDKLALDPGYVPLRFIRHPSEEERKNKAAPRELRHDDAIEQIKKDRLARVIGDAGQGKSTFARRFCLELTKTALKQKLSRDAYYPLFISCRDLSASKFSNKDAFLDRLAGALKGRGGAIISRAELDKLLRDANPFFIFDGLDEVAPEQAGRILDAIWNTFKEEDIHLLFTTRPGQAKIAGQSDYNLFENAPVHRYTVCELDEVQQKEYVERYTSVNERCDKEKFLEAVAEKEKLPDYQRISRNPFMLYALYSAYGDGHDLPETRFAALDRMIDRLIDRELKQKADQEEMVRSGLTRKKVKRVLGCAAVAINRQRDGERNVFADPGTEDFYDQNEGLVKDEEPYMRFFRHHTLIDENGFYHEFFTAAYAAYYLYSLPEKEYDRYLTSRAEYWRSASENLLCLLDDRGETDLLTKVLQTMQAVEPDYDFLCRAVGQFKSHRSECAALLLKHMLDRGVHYLDRHIDGVNPYEELFYYPAVYPFLQEELDQLEPDGLYLRDELIKEVQAVFSKDAFERLSRIYEDRFNSDHRDEALILELASERRGDFEVRGFGQEDYDVRRIIGFIRVKGPQYCIEDRDGLYSAYAISEDRFHEYDGYTVPEGRFAQCKGLTGIMIPEGITEIENSAFSGCSSLSQVVIPESIEELDPDAFSRCSSLKRVVIRNSAMRVGSNPFAECAALETIEVSGSQERSDDSLLYEDGILRSEDGVLYSEKKGRTILVSCPGAKTAVTILDGTTDIGWSSFYACTRLKSITIPESIRIIDGYAFFGCESLESIAIPYGTTFIDESAFCYCSSLKEVDLKKCECDAIPVCAFQGCSSLEKVDLPEEVTEIGEEAFSECTMLKRITIPDTVTEIGEGAFSFCSSLTEIDVSDGNEVFCSVDGMLYSKDKKLLLTCPGERTEVTVPDGTEELSDFAFCGCKSLKRIVIPASVKVIEKDCFSGCSSLEGVEIAKENENYRAMDGVLYSGDGSRLIFCWNIKMRSVVIPAGVKTIEGSAFSGCTSLESVKIGDTVETIENDAFNHCTSLAELTFGEQVKSIGESAFWDCRSLTEIVFPERIKKIDRFAFLSCRGLERVTIPGPDTEIGDDAFGLIRDLTIRAPKGSRAEEYAARNRIRFEYIVDSEDA